MHDVDHLVYATADVEATVDSLAEVLGVRAAVGGQHPGRGTCNALVGLGACCYLEIVGPDARQPAPDKPRWFGIDGLKAPRLAAWAVRARDLEVCSALAAEAGLPAGPLVSGSRQRPDGTWLFWRFTDPALSSAGGVAPFFIDWGAGPHPAEALPAGARLLGLRAEHPEAPRLEALLQRLALRVSVVKGAVPRLFATLKTPRGLVELE